MTRLRTSRLSIATAVMCAVLCTATIAIAAIVSGTATTGSSSQVSTTELVLSKPTVSAGDLMLASIAINGGDSASTTAPSGWSQIARTDNDSDVALITYWKIATTSEPSSYTWTVEGQTTASGGIVPYSGIYTVTPIDSFSSNSGYGSLATASATTSTVTDQMVVTVFAADVGKSTYSGAYFSTPTGFTEKYDVSSTPFGPSLAAAERTQAISGSTGSATSTITGGVSQHWAAQQIVIRRAPILCTGGTVTYFDNRVIHTFTSDGTFDCSAADAKTVNALIVGGGGGGGKPGSFAGGGGGGGGFVEVASRAISADDYAIDVGLGGDSSVDYNSPGSNGENSSFDGIVALGGGGGGTLYSINGVSGGSGGGGAGPGSSAGAASTTQGNPGGVGLAGSAGGGGGAGEPGHDATLVGGTAPYGGNGGDGLPSLISGASVYYAGGGGGNGQNTDGLGGLGGGGDTGPAAAGTPNTGGGAGTSSSGVTGGSGIVIISYPLF